MGADRGSPSRTYTLHLVLHMRERNHNKRQQDNHVTAVGVFSLTAPMRAGGSG